MKRDIKSGSDDALGNVLKQWNVDASPSPRFQENVWQRIALSATETKRSFFDDCVSHVENLFRRPALAVSYLAVLLFLGSGFGYFQANQTRAEARSQFEAMYVQSVDPYQVTRDPL